MRTQTKPLRRPLASGLAGVVIVATRAACGTTRDPGSAATTSTPPAAAPSAAAPSATSTPASFPTSIATSPSAVLNGIPLYWVGESRRSFALYRELRDVPDTGGPIASAVSAMTRLKPLDPDYLSPWRPASTVSVSQVGNAITVDLSNDAFANTQVGSEVAGAALQQLVYTATAAAQRAGTPASSVKITVDGAAGDAWGVMRLGEAMQRAPMSTTQAHTWVTSPQEGQSLPSGTVTFKGYGTSFEANFTWEVRNQAGVVVAKGFTMGGSGDGTFGQFTFTAQLRAGTYSVEVSGGDASGGAEGPGAATDDKTFTVR